MSRNSSGTYSLPAGNPVVTLTTITSTWANTTLADVRTELTDSLCRSGKGAMLAPLLAYVGTSLLPGLTFDGDPDSGLYRIGANSIGMAMGGVLNHSWSTTGSTFALGLTVTQSQANTAGVTTTGNGTAPGVAATGGVTGAGVTGAGGATSGVGGAFSAMAGNSIGATGAGNGSGAGVAGTGGATGPGVTGAGGGTSGNGGTFSATAGHGVAGTSGGASNAGVLGTAGAGASAVGVKGVAGNANNGAAVYGQSNHADASGVYGQTNFGNGALTAALWGDSSPSGGYAVVAFGRDAASSRSALRVVPQATAPAEGQVGDMYVTAAGVLKICTVAGTPGTWVSVGAQ